MSCEYNWRTFIAQACALDVKDEMNWKHGVHELERV